MSWVQSVNDRGLEVVAAALGLTTPKRYAGTLTPCPSCGEVRREPETSRGPIGTRGSGWQCHRCGLKGGPLDLVSAALFRRIVRAGETGDWAKLRKECEDLGLLSGQTPHRETPRAELVMRRDVVPPNQGQVAQVWDECTGSAANDEGVAKWLTHRHLDPAVVTERDLARALCPGVREVPDWLFRGDPDEGAHPWHRAPQEWRVLCPLFDAHGKLRSLHARALHPRAPKGRDKSVLPRHCASAGFVMANRLGRLLLEGNESAVREVARSDARIRAQDDHPAFGLVVVEGIPDYLTVSTTWHERPFPAVIGIFNGAWTPDVADRVPDGTRVLIATDPDDAGETYASVVRSTLKGRCKLLRWWSTDDVNASGLAAGGIHEMEGALKWNGSS